MRTLEDLKDSLGRSLLHAFDGHVTITINGNYTEGNLEYLYTWSRALARALYELDQIGYTIEIVKKESK